MYNRSILIKQNALSCRLSVSVPVVYYFFQDLTGIEDIDRCRATLVRHNWDIEVRILEFSFDERNDK